MSISTSRYDEDWVIDEIDWKGGSPMRDDDEPLPLPLTPIREEEDMGTSEDERMADQILEAPVGRESIKWRATKYIAKRSLRLPWWVYTLFGRWLLVTWGTQLMPAQTPLIIGTVWAMYYVTIAYRMLQ